MNKRIAAELRTELQYIEAGIDVEKHAYAMERLLGLLTDPSEVSKVPSPKLEDNVTKYREPLVKPAEDEEDDGNGKDIFDF